jgi:RNA polymerase sigma-70 factor (ECF subfamily)
MTDDPSFADLIRRIRSGDSQAAEELVRRYEPAVRLEVRLRLRDVRLRRLCDSMDICQSVLGSFFVRAAAGQFDLDRPDQLLKLLVAMARNNVAYQARKERAKRRDSRRLESVGPATRDVAAADPSPSRLLAGKELLAELWHRLGAEERRLADLRAGGLSWDEIAAELGGTPAARRMQLARAVDHVAHQLGLDEMRHE